jgi:chromosome segregation ATPase
MAESKVQEVITRPGGSPIQRERTEEDYLDEIRQLKATIDDLTKRLKSQTTKEPPSQLALNFYELEIELGKKQSELNAMDAELESTIHRLWMAEERNSELQNKLDQKMMIWNAFGESASSGYPYKEV